MSIEEAQLFHQQGRFVEAEEAYLAALKDTPNSSEILFYLGTLYLQANRFDAAVESLKKALQLEPKNPAFLNNLGLAHVEMEQHEEAIRCFQHACIFHSTADSFYNLGNAYKGIRQFDRAKQAFKQAIKLDHLSPRAYNGLGLIEEMTGNIDTAIELFEKSITCDSSFSSAYKNLAQCKTFTVADQTTIDKIEILLKEGNITTRDKISASFALGKIHKDCGHIDTALAHFDLANQLKSDSTPYQPEQFTEYVSAIISRYDSNFLDNIPQFSKPKFTPVFIVGAPRSGTTLFEQMLMQLSGIGSIGEDSFSLRWFNEYSKQTREAYPDCLTRLSTGNIKDFIQNYSAYCLNLSDNDMILNKYLSTPFYLGLFLTSFPDAAVFYCERCAKDCRLSMYFTDFTQGHPFTNKLSDIDAYLADYERLMQFWEKLYPGRIMRIRYEDLVMNNQETLESCCKFLGVPFETACLDHTKAENGVVTASAAQVRKPLYKSAIGQWKLFQDLL